MALSDQLARALDPALVEIVRNDLGGFYGDALATLQGEVERLQGRVKDAEFREIGLHDALRKETAEVERLTEALRRLGEMAGAKANGADARAMGKLARQTLAFDEEQR